MKSGRALCASLIGALLVFDMAAPRVAQGDAALDSGTLRLVAAPGQSGVAVYSKTEAGGKRMEFALLAFGATQAAPIREVVVGERDSDQKMLHVRAGTAEAEFSLDEAGVVTISPGRNAATVEIRTGARYAVLPDFFADDVVFDPVHLAMPTLTVPAENFLLELLPGGNTMVMCIWPGRLKQTRAGAPKAAPKEDKASAEPRVDLVFSGEGKARRISAARIEFQNRPVYAGVIEQKGVWQDEDARGLPTYKPTAIAWKRPFEARWRGDYVVAEGKRLADWPSRNQSFDFKSTSAAAKDSGDALDVRFLAATSSARDANWWKKGVRWWEEGTEDAPQIWQESLPGFFIYPAVFKGDEVRLCLYADKNKRDQRHVYERVIIYPLGRAAATPLDIFTPVDLMRQTLGQGPCEYILDLAGVKPRQAGGDRQTLAYATCGLWNAHIFPIVRQIKKRPDGTFEPLDEKTKTHLIQAIEDMWYFVHAIHNRLREYKQWCADGEAFCQRESARHPKVKRIADLALAHLGRLNSDLGRHKLEGPNSEAYWKDRIPELIGMIKMDQYAEVASIGKIRDLGNDQDERVSRCRQYVKAVLQEIVFQDTRDPDVRAFAAELRDRCHRMLRNQHPKEGF
jgi:hypothetical protein